jgi:protocatechuate 3,4-dioxygenase beta subunit
MPAMSRNLQATRWVVGLALVGAAALLWVLSTGEAHDEREVARVAAGGEAGRDSVLEGRSGADLGAPAPLVEPAIDAPAVGTKGGPGAAVDRAAEHESVWVEFEVLTPTGEPVSDATLGVWSPPSQPLPRQRMAHADDPPRGVGHAGSMLVPSDEPDDRPADLVTTTGADGRCRVLVPRGPCVFSAASPTVGWSGYRSVAVDEGQLDGLIQVALSAPTHLMGRVVDRQDHPVPGARVHFAGESYMYELPHDQDDRRSRDPPDLIADGQGRFCVDVDGKYFGTVRAESGPHRSVAFPLVGQDEIELQIGKGLEIEGIVTDPEGQPIPGASVRITSPLLPVEPVEVHTCDEPSGSFLAEVAHVGTWIVFASQQESNMTTCEPVRVTVSEAQPQARVEIRLCTTVRITGRVRDQLGAPVSGLDVLPRVDLSRFSDWIKLGVEPHAPEATTDLDGRFSLGGLQPGIAYDLTTYDLGSSGSSKHRVTLAKGVSAGAADVEIVVDPSASREWSVRGLVVDAASQNPVSDCAIELQRFEPILDFWVPALPKAGEVRREGDGRFRVTGLDREQSYRIAVTPRGGEEEAFPIPAPAEGTDEALVLAVSSRASLEIHVVDERGAPLPRVEVSALDEASLSTFVAVSPAASKWSGPDGRAVFEAVRAGSYLVQSRWDEGGTSGLARIVVEHGDAGETTLRLTRNAAAAHIRVRVTNPKGDPVSGVTISIDRLGMPQSSSAAEGLTDTHGEYLSPGLSPGVHRLRCSSETYGYLKQGIVLLWGDETVDLDCPVSF